jgi:hypothetical protein
LTVNSPLYFPCPDRPVLPPKRSATLALAMIKTIPTSAAAPDRRPRKRGICVSVAGSRIPHCEFRCSKSMVQVPVLLPAILRFPQAQSGVLLDTPRRVEMGLTYFAATKLRTLLDTYFDPPKNAQNVELFTPSRATIQPSRLQTCATRGPARPPTTIRALGLERLCADTLRSELKTPASGPDSDPV